MSDPVQVQVKSSLSKVIAELAAIRDQAEQTGDAIRDSGRAMGSELGRAQRGAKEAGDAYKKAGDAVGDGLRGNVKRTETFFGQLRSLSRRVADQLRGDFKSLVSVNALTDALKLSGQFRQSVSETVELSDTIRKLGTTFGIASSQFASFQTKMTEGLGDIGMSSDVAARSLEGLAKTPVRGEGNLLAYSKGAGMLASISNSKGSEGDIAGGIARVIQARGGNVNDTAAVAKLAESLRRIYDQTGTGPAESLKNMEALFASMPADLRKAISDTGLSNLAAASAVGGPNATKFLEEYLSKSPVARMAFDAQGGKGIMTDKGIDAQKFATFAKSIMGRVGGDPRLAAQTLGLSDDAAEGFVRLAENLDKVTAAQDRIERATGNLTSQYRETMGLGEAFAANINKVKKALAGPMSAVTQGGTGLLSKASQSTGGAAAVVAGGAGLAALLAGIGLKGVGRGIGGIVGTAARTQGAESLLGAKTVPVYVVNVDEFGGAGGGGGALGGLLGAGEGAAGGAAAAGGGGLLSVLAPIVAIAAGVYAGYKVKEGIDSDIAGAGKDTTNVQYSPDQLRVLQKSLEGGKIPEGRRSEVEKILADNMIVPTLAPKAATGVGGPAPAGGVASAPTQTVKHIIELNKRDLRDSRQPTRGASN